MSEFLIEVEDGQILLSVNTAIYSKAALFRTCYVFTDRCYLFLFPEVGGGVQVFIKSKNTSTDLKQIAGDFCNELIDQQVRQDLIQETGEIRKLIVAHAFAEGDLLDETKDHASYREDPLGVGKR